MAGTGTAGGGMAGGGMSGAGAGGAGAGGGGAGGAGGNSLGAHCTGCTKTKVGNPLWEPSGAVLVAGDVGSTTPDPFIAQISNIAAPNHAWDANDFIIGPAVAHAGPYGDEMYSLVTARSMTVKQAFTVSEFTAPSGVLILLTLVPSAGAATGSSFDFDTGPIIPNALFPIANDGDLYRNGVLYDAAFDGSYSGYPGQNPPIVKDGPSHLPYFFGENSFFGPPATPATGSYEFRLRMTDSGGAGWTMVIPFTVN
jgi:hypothetical protein